MENSRHIVCLCRTTTWMHTSTVVSALQIEGAIGSGQYFELDSRTRSTITVENKHCIVFVCMTATWVYAAIVISAFQIHVTSAGGDGLELQSRTDTAIVKNNRHVLVCMTTIWMQTAATCFVLKVEIRSWHNKQQQQVGAFYLNASGNRWH